MPGRTAEELIMLNRTLIATAEQVCAFSQELISLGAARRAGGSPDGRCASLWMRLMLRTEVQSRRDPLTVPDALTDAADRAHRASRRALAAGERADLHHQHAADARARAHRLAVDPPGLSVLPTRGATRYRQPVGHG